MKTLSVVVPVYFNEGSLRPLAETLSQVESKLKEKGVQVQRIFVDDGSGDGSLAALLDIKAGHENTKVVKHSRNFGAPVALKTGFQFVDGDCFTILTADLQDPPELLLEMVDKWLAGARYVVCARTERDDPWTSKLLAAGYHWLLRLLVVRDYPTGGYDIALMDRVFLPYLQSCGKNINISLFAHSLGFAPETIFYKRQARAHGTSRWTLAKKLKFFVDSILGFSMLPLRLISITGMAVATLSFAYGVVVVVSALLGHPDFVANRGFAALASLLSFLLGLIIVMLGLIGEYIWRIFDEVNRRPEAVIEEIY